MSITLLSGDCRDVLLTLAANSVHCVVSADTSAILWYDAGMNDGRIKKGQRLSPATEFKPGQHWRPHGKHRERGWLEHHYVTLGQSTGDIAKAVGFTEAAVLFWLRKHGIPRRSISAVRALKRWGVVGEANPMFGKRGAECPRYIDGSSPERQRMYSRSEGFQFLQDVYRRDNWTCARCGEKKGGKRSLAAHHLKPWAGHPELRFDMSNVVSLCVRCHLWVHSKANTERAYLA
jgi:5-methylcytosine-specific restriction endonuclease McrA